MKADTCNINPAWTPQELPTASQAVEMREGKDAARAGLPFTQTFGRWWSRGWVIYHLTERPEPSWRTH